MLCPAAAAPVLADGHEFQLNGAYSVATQSLRDSLSRNYGIGSIDYAFTDYGGKYFYRRGLVDPGLSAGIYSSIASRAQIAYSTAAAASVVVTPTTTYLAGDYRLGLAWAPLMARARIWFVQDLVFMEAGLGPAYGFGAAQFQSTTQTSGVTSVDTRYQKFSEWGLMTSLAVGFNFKLIANLGLQIFIEGAHIYAKIRNPDLTQTDSITWSQFFVRPGLAIVFNF